MAGRSYLSSLAIDGPFGVGWSPTVTARLYYAVYLFSAPSTYQKLATIVMPDGSRWAYIDNGNGTFTPPTGRHDTLVKNADSTFDLTLQRGRAKFHFGSDGSLLSLADEFGNALNYTYDVNGRIQQILDAAGSGRFLTIGWGTDGRISTITDNSGRHVQYGYNAQGALTTVTDAANRVESLGYTPGRFGPLLDQVVNQGTGSWNLIVTTVTYDSSFRVQSYTENDETYTYTYAYGGVPLSVKKADSSGYFWVYTFLANGLITDRTPPFGGGGNMHTDYYADNSGQLYTDGVGVKTYATYDAQGNYAQITKDFQGALAVRYDYAYDPNFPSKVTSVTPKDPATGNVNLDWQASRYDYYQAGSAAPGALFHAYRVRDDGTALDTLATYVYNSHGQVTQATSGSGGVTDYAYDAAGNLWKVTGPANNDGGTRPVTTYLYDSLGRTTSVTDALSHSTTYVYDNADRLTTVTLPKPSTGSTLTFTTSYSYDNFDSVSKLVFTNITDANGLVTKQGYDQFGQLNRDIDPQNGVTLYTHTKGLLTSISDANNNVTSYSYDPGRRLSVKTLPTGATQRIVYYDDGLVQSQEVPSFGYINHSYDSLKRLVQKTEGNTLTYTYDGQKLVNIDDVGGALPETHALGYDSSYRLASATQGTRGTINYQYNSDDTILNYSVQGGPSTTYSYYPDGSLNTIVWSPVAGSFKYRYTLTGQDQSLSLPSGATRNYYYDDQRRVTQLTNLSPSSANLATYAYGYDFDYTNSLYDRKGQRVSVTATVPAQGLSNHVFKYEYDPLYQLTRVTYPNVAPFNAEVDSWTYDGIGNRLTSTVNSTTKNYLYQKVGANPLNWQRLLSDGANTYTYWENGATNTRTGYTFGWDLELRMTSISGTASYVYDYEGRRSRRTVGAATNSYLYDALNLIQESGATSADYLFRPGIDEPLAMSRGGQIFYYVIDGLGSVAEVTDASGAVQNSYVYDGWGQVRTQSGSLVNPFTYTARDSGEASTMFYRARYYQPNIGRFLSGDPVGDIGSTAFAYAGNSPVLHADPLGLYQIIRPGSCRLQIEGAFARVNKETMEKHACPCEDYAKAHGRNLSTDSSPGGPPYVYVRPAEDFKTKPRTCGYSEGNYMFINEGCCAGKGPCDVGTLILHELLHEWRRDTTDDETSDDAKKGFKACAIGCMVPGNLN